MSRIVHALAGRGWLVCPQLLAIDARHRRHWSKVPPCGRGLDCKLEVEFDSATGQERAHVHEEPVADGEGHTGNDMRWAAGATPVPDEHWPRCIRCGRRLVYGDLDNPETSLKLRVPE